MLPQSYVKKNLYNIASENRENTLERKLFQIGYFAQTWHEHVYIYSTCQAVEHILIVMIISIEHAAIM